VQAKTIADTLSQLTPDQVDLFQANNESSPGAASRLYFKVHNMVSSKAQSAAMIIEHINRKGKAYYLHEGKTKTGKPKYFFSQKSEGNLVSIVPEGYEIYENPNAQVFLRKIQPQIVTPEEINIVQSGVKRYAKVKHFIIDVKGKCIVVYLCNQNIDELTALTSMGFGGSTAKMQETLLRAANYSPMMQFVLEDEQIREFRVERWCFLGSVDDWMMLDSGRDLKALVKKYAPHLGQESFYELML
jgi:hypothetical protein